METSDIIALAALAIAILSPFLTAYLNNRHQLKMKRIEFNLEHRAQVIENYIRATGDTIFTHKPSSAHQYGAFYGEIFVYLPIELWPLLLSINEKFKQSLYDEAQPEFFVLCQQLAKLEVRPDVQPKLNLRSKKAKIKRKHTAP